MAGERSLLCCIVVSFPKGFPKTIFLKKLKKQKNKTKKGKEKFYTRKKHALVVCVFSPMSTPISYIVKFVVWLNKSSYGIQSEDSE